MEKLVRFGITIPERLLHRYDQILERKHISNRSEAIRQLIRQDVSRNYWETDEAGKDKVYGTITITFDHHSRDAGSTLTSVQHDFGDVIVCSTHIHVDHDHCLEVIVTCGQAEKIKNLVEALSALKCIDSVDPVITAII